MADILTHLREISFGYSILKKGELIFNDSPEEFLSFCQINIENTEILNKDQISSRATEFTEEEKRVIQNGLKLGKFVLDSNIITDSNPTIKWLGGNTQSGTAIDIEIADIPFSLKEDSFVLHNMGLYQLINIIVDKVIFKRGLHIFEEFSPVELDNWFKITRNRMIEILKIQSFETVDSSSKNIKLAYSGDYLYLFYNGIELKIRDFGNCDYTRFKTETSSKLREKVFSKFINNKLSADFEYIAAKKICAEKAGEKLVEYLKSNITENPSPHSLFNLFRIINKSYYYAKTTNTLIEVYKIPSQEEFSSKIKITDIRFEVPDSQLNLYTTIENIETNEKLVVRNELRYSHGQLNGTPEAKMYISQGTLLIAYKEID